MEKGKFKISSILLCIVLAFALIGCDDASSQILDDEFDTTTHSYEQIELSEILDPDIVDDYTPLREDEDFDAENYLQDSMLYSYMMMAESASIVPYIIENYENEDGDISSTKDITMDIIMHIDDELLNYVPNDINTTGGSLDIKWFDLILSGSMYDPLADLINEDFNEIDKEMSLDLSTYFVCEVDEVNIYCPYSIDFNFNIDQDDSSDMVLSGKLDFSFASKLYDDTDNTLGVLRVNLNIEEIEEFNGADYEYVGEQITGIDSESDLSEVWNNIENRIWGSTTADHISLEIVIADSEGVVESETLSDDELFETLYTSVMSD